MRSPASLVLLTLMASGPAGLVACGASEEAPDPPGPCGSDSRSVASTTGRFAPEPVSGSACGAVIHQEPVPAAPIVHSPLCSPLVYSTNPPSSGEHYAVWADFREYAEPVPRGFWVHSLEHGALVLAYRCTDCDDEVQAARELIETLPEDPSCARFGRVRRVVLTPDPLLDVRWAAARWGVTLRSDCFEPESFRAFAERPWAGAPENTCATP